MPVLVIALAVYLLGSVHLAGAVEECDEAMCVGGPTSCVIDQTHVLRDDCFLDFGSKEVSILGVLSAAEPESGSFKIRAGKITLYGKLEALGGGSIDVNVVTDFKIVSVDHSLARINVNGGGTVDITAGNDVIFGAESNVTLDGTDNLSGGELLVIAGRNITSANNATISANGSQTGNGGKVSLWADGDISLDGTITADTSGADSYAGFIEIRPGPSGNLTISHTVEATTTDTGAFDGLVQLGPACNVTVSDSVKTRANLATGQGENVIRYSGTATFTADSHMLADDVGNRILCRCQDTNHDLVCDGGCTSSPVIAAQADFRPAHTVMPVPLPPCGCGNGIVESSLGEQCDDGNSVNTDGCRYDCRLPACGDGMKDAGEDCDLGALNGSSGVCCTSGCLFKTSGSSCSDGSVCTQTDQCNVSGQCVGSNPVTCTPLDQCHNAGTCNPTTGCSNPIKPNGTTCNDTNGCTTNDVCTNGVCSGTCNSGATCGSSCGGTLTCHAVNGGCQCQ